MHFKKKSLLNIKLKTFTILVVLFEILIHLSVVYKISLLSSTEKELISTYTQKIETTNMRDKISQKISLLSNENEKHFKHIYLLSLFFIIGNLLIYFLLKKKIFHPIKYLTHKLVQLQEGEYTQNKTDESFYKDEIGLMIEQFFLMQDTVNNQKNILENLNQTLTSSFDKYIISSKTDLQGRITYASEAFSEACGYSQKELLGKPHNIIRHPDTPKKEFKDMWEILKAEKTWKGEIKNSKKDGGFYWEDAVISPLYDIQNNLIGYSAIGHDITAKKEVEELTSHLEEEIQAQTKSIQAQKEFVQTILDSQEQIIITLDSETLTSVNETFMDFFAVDSIQDFKDEYNGDCISKTFNTQAPKGYVQVSMGHENWIEHVISRSAFGELNKVMITRGSTDFIFSVTAAALPGENREKSAVFTNITDMEIAKQETEAAKIEIEAIHKHTNESIEYASLIQGALIPNNTLASAHFKDYFAVWNPKDIVGGDIYFFEELTNENESIIMVIDCTGHGVPGAFVTMLVKAIERQIISTIKHNNEAVSPAKILSIFNSSIKHLLHHNSTLSVVQSGFDGQVMYYNKKENIIKLASARNEVFYYQDNTLHTIKGDRKSIGDSKSDANYTFTEHIIDVSKETSLYLFTDGYWDQLGGEKNLPFGKKRLKNLLNKVHKKSMNEQQKELLQTLEDYKQDNEATDDITIVGLKV